MQRQIMEPNWLKDKVRNFSPDGRTNIYFTIGDTRFGGVDIKTKYLLNNCWDIFYRAIEILKEKHGEHGIQWDYCPEMGMNILFEELDSE